MNFAVFAPTLETMPVTDRKPQVIWVGGGSGAGKTTISRILACRHDLAWYRIDARAYEHHDKLVARGLVEKSDETHGDRWVNPSPQELARRFIAGSQTQFPLILDDLAAMGTQVGIVVEGPQLLPSLVAPHLASARHGVWLLPSDEFRRRALGQRVTGVERTGDPATAYEKLIQRNKLLDAYIRTEAESLGLATFDVDVTDDLPRMLDRVGNHFSEVLAVLPRIRSGRERQRLRAYENDMMVRNAKAFFADLGAEDAARSVPFVCECERLGCAVIIDRTLAQYDESRAAGTPITGHPK